MSQQPTSRQDDVEADGDSRNTPASPLPMSVEAEWRLKGIPPLLRFPRSRRFCSSGPRHSELPDRSFGRRGGLTSPQPFARPLETFD